MHAMNISAGILAGALSLLLLSQGTPVQAAGKSTASGSTLPVVATTTRSRSNAQADLVELSDAELTRVLTSFYEDLYPDESGSGTGAESVNYYNCTGDPDLELTSLAGCTNLCTALGVDFGSGNYASRQNGKSGLLFGAVDGNAYPIEQVGDGGGVVALTQQKDDGFTTDGRLYVDARTLIDNGILTSGYLPPAGTSADGTGRYAKAEKVTATLGLSYVMNGCTLRDGESVAAIYRTGSATYVVPASVNESAGTVTVTIPVLDTTGNSYLIFTPARTSWEAGTDTIDYLAIGNSITMHPRRSYWPNTMGMGASSIEKDYFHEVTSFLQSGAAAAGLPVHSMAINYSAYEDPDREESAPFSTLDPYLSDALDYVSIQLGENAIGDAAFDTAYVSLVDYIKNACPHATVILIGNFWQDDTFDTIKKSLAASSDDIVYADLAPIQNDPDYSFGVGIAYDADGVGYLLNSYGTSLHPNDAGMAYIAQAVEHAIAPEAAADPAEGEPETEQQETAESGK